MAERWVTIDTLRRNIGAEIVKSIVDTQLEFIDDKIISINDAGGNCCEYDLPTTPTVGSLPLKQAQTLVYSEILRTFRTPVSEGGKGFDRTYLRRIGTRAILRIEWENVLSDDEYSQRLAYIEECMFVRRSSTAAQ